MYYNSIRAKFGLDGSQNAVHGSDSPSSADREIGLVFTPEHAKAGAPVPIEEVGLQAALEANYDNETFEDESQQQQQEQQQQQGQEEVDAAKVTAAETTTTPALEPSAEVTASQ